MLPSLGIPDVFPEAAARQFERVGHESIQGGYVELSIIALNFGYAILGVLLMYSSYRVIDHFTPQVDFPEELKRGNIAVAIFIAALFLSIAIIVGNALG